MATAPDTVNIDQYDFLDFGASLGLSMKFAQEHLGGGKGLGVDISPEKVQKSREAGFDCIEADASDLPFPDNSVRFVVISHLLEHLPGFGLAEKIIASAARVASDFVFIQGPYFDADDYLASLGYIPYFSTWVGHTCHLTTTALYGILEKLDLGDHLMMAVGPLESSADNFILPLGAPPDSMRYDPQVHGPKPTRVFTQPVYKEMVCLVRLRELDYWNEILLGKLTAYPLNRVLLPSHLPG